MKYKHCAISQECNKKLILCSAKLTLLKGQNYTVKSTVELAIDDLYQKLDQEASETSKKDK